MDEAREWTDEQLKDMIKNLQKVYGEAKEEITKKWLDYMQKSGEKIKALQKDYEHALKYGDKEEIKQARQKLIDAKKSQIYQSERYKALTDEFLHNLADVNSVAVDYLNGQIPKVYATNYNYINTEYKSLKISFNLVDEHTVKLLMSNREIDLIPKKLDIPKDIRWNRKQLNSSVLQGILQGESMDKIAKRILPIVDNNKNSAIRNARTMVTNAECRGRLDRYENLENDGLVLEKKWIATPDKRTRDAHLVMDGQRVPIDKPFIDGDGYELMMPADPTAPSKTIYNCRCSMSSRVVGIRQADGTIKPITIEEQQGTHQRAIKQEKKKREGKNE